MSKKQLHDDEWPEFIYEREPETDVERIDEALRGQGIKVKSKMEGDITADLEPGDKLQLHWREIELEMMAGGIARILVEGEQVWSGRLGEIKNLHTWSSSIDKQLYGLAINGKLVWLRQLDH
jgi:hypothetical protein